LIDDPSETKSPPDAASSEAALDLESQLDEIASELDFDLDGQELDDDLSGAEAALESMDPIGPDDSVPLVGKPDEPAEESMGETAYDEESVSGVKPPRSSDELDADELNADELGDDELGADLIAASESVLDAVEADGEEEGVEELEEVDAADFEEVDAADLEELDADDLQSIEPVDRLEAIAALEEEPAQADEESVEDEGPLGPLFLELDGQFAAVDQDRFVIGRVSKMCDLTIVDVNVSRQHCAIERREDAYYVVDLGSTNGVIIDGNRVNDHRIEEGDVLVLSSHRLYATFEAPSMEEPPIVQRNPLAEARLPQVTGKLRPVGGEMIADDEPEAESEPEPLPDPEPEPLQPVVDEQPSVVARRTPTTNTAAAYDPSQDPDAIAAAQAAQAQVAAGTFEQRMEAKLDQLTQQVAYLQQQMQVLMAQTQQIQGIAGLAQLIQQKLADRRR